ncbi:M61 family metallopeptidase [Glaciecola siphonariae]|uniref:M61 family metallopeptidase n=1 Tax=Glaciecola siphonariae TaxID=521012 RepID=A0ABV9LU51_9ALTE
MHQAFISYQISAINLSEHLFEVGLKAHLPEPLNRIELTLPAWIPGSYMIRDFARNVLQIQSQHNDLVIQKTDKQTWQIRARNDALFQQLDITYRIFAFDLSVRSAYINHEFAFFNGTSTLLNVVGHEHLTHYLQVLPNEQVAHWQTQTAMPLSENYPHTLHRDYPVYASESYDILIDHPVLSGDLCKRSFVVSGVTFHVVFTGRETMDLDRICDDLKPICEHHIRLFGECPVDEYWFMTLLCENGFGGLEHKSSTVLQYARFDLPMLGDSEEKSESYQQFLSLCSHELFHTWHVKRIRPKVMLKPDLSQETYTPQLWIYEGFTSLYDDLTLARAQLISPLEYCQILGQSVTRLMRNPGRHLQSISESSFDAWTRFYKQDASSVNHIVSYYLKGSIVALALDITLRQQSDNKYSLDDVMRELWKQFGQQESGTLDNVVADICKHSLGIDVSSFLHVAVDSVMDLPLSSMVNSIGLSLNMRSRETFTDKGGKPAKLPQTRDLGLMFAEQSLGMKVTQVLASSASAQAGIQLNDIIVACNGFKASPSKLNRMLQATALEDTVTLHIMRDEQLIEVKLKARPAQLDTCFFTIEDESAFMRWLGLEG